MPIGRILRYAAVLVFCAMSAAAAHPPGVADKDQAVAHEVEALREFVKRAIAKKNLRALRAIYADGFTHTHGSGRVDGKDARIAALVAGEPAIETAPVEDLNYRVFADHTIIVTGKSAIRNKAENRTHQLRWIAVYVKTKGEWQIGASQATRLP
jgi:hypothetical protein